MSRIRSIKPEFWTSAQVMECSIPTRLFFIGIWNFCDDWGRHPASEKQLKALIFPADDISVDAIRRMIDELSANDLIRRYDVDGKQYFVVTGWQHQKIDRRQDPKFPPPPGSFVECSSNGIDGREGKGEKVRDANASLVSAEAPTLEPPVNLKIERDRKKQAADREKLLKLGEDWNGLASECGLAQIEEIPTGSPRERAALARIREGVDFDRMFAKIRGSPFLRGESGWRADFNWVINPTNVLKVLEGNYDEDRQARRGKRA